MADELGFWGAVLPDHYMWGPEMGGDSTLDSWVVLAFLAARTRRIKLGTLVTPIPLRPPTILAKILSTLDLISKGRVVLGVGAGWSRLEFEGYGEWNDSKVRVEKTREGLDLILRLWSDAKVTFKGRYYQTNNAVLEPKPIQKPHPPLLFGGTGPRMLRLAGRLADICYLPPYNETDLQRAKEIVSAEARRCSRINELAFAVEAVGPQPNVGLYDSKIYQNGIEEAKKNGNNYVMVSFPYKRYLKSLRAFGRDLRDSFAD